MASDSKGGMMVPYEIKMCADKKKGFGVFATKDILKGTLVWKWDPKDHIALHEETLKAILKRMDTDKQRHDYLQYCYTQEPGQVVYELDNGKFTNHSKDPNTGIDFYHDMTMQHNFALRDIRKGEEITEDYEKNGSNFYPQWFYPLAKKYGVWLC